MKRIFSLVWLLVVVVAVGHLGWRTAVGWSFQTDLMALLPLEDRDPAIDRAKRTMAEAVSQRVVILIGHTDSDVARRSAAGLSLMLQERGLLKTADVPTADGLAQLGAAYFPYRAWLLAESDRQLLSESRGQEIVARTLSQIYGFGAVADSRILRADPFLLLPSFLAQLPIPASRLTLDRGTLTVQEGQITWALVSGKVTGEPYALDFQNHFIAGLEMSLDPLRTATPDLQVLRLGALFYAAAGAQSAMAETSWIGTIASVGSVLLVIVVFRSMMPAVLSLLAIAVGLLAALSVSLAIFGDLHIAALLFGAALIGVTVDYSTHYFAQIFSSRPTADTRLAHVMPGLLQGVITTLVGFGMLALAPFPGLRQIAVFSMVGVLASFLTVVLWIPLFDRAAPRRLGERAGQFTQLYWSLWNAPRFRPALIVALVVWIGASGAGFLQLEVSDDVRRQQRLAPELQAEETRVRALTGFGNTAQFFVVRGATTEEVLARQEALGERLAVLVRTGALGDWLGPARFVPSAGRQRENAALIGDRLVAPYFVPLREQLRLTTADLASVDSPSLTLEAVLRSGALPFLSPHVLGDTIHVVSLTGLTRPEEARAATEGLPGVHFVDPTADISALLGDYRRRAVVLLGLSVLAMVPFMAWRHGWRGTLRVLAPPAAAAAATPGLLALVGMPFTFFSAMALILVLAIGVDYAVFCAEDREHRQAVTVISLLLATATTVLSFGLLAWTSVAAVQSFGAAMLVGDLLAFLLAPIAARPHRPLKSQASRS